VAATDIDRRLYAMRATRDITTARRAPILADVPSDSPQRRSNCRHLAGLADGGVGGGYDLRNLPDVPTDARSALISGIQRRSNTPRRPHACTNP